MTLQNLGISMNRDVYLNQDVTVPLLAFPIIY